eukprot:COSAG01_NODE_2139_length_8323_cov_13.355788_2_plen_49_part_00
MVTMCCGRARGNNGVCMEIHAMYLHTCQKLREKIILLRLMPHAISHPL